MAQPEFLTRMLCGCGMQKGLEQVGVFVDPFAHMVAWKCRKLDLIVWEAYFSLTFLFFS